MSNPAAAAAAAASLPPTTTTISTTKQRPAAAPAPKSTSNRSRSSRPPIPWSKKHKAMTRASSGGLRYKSLSNSFGQPLTSAELVQMTQDRGDDDSSDLLDMYLKDHSLEYTPNGGSWDLRTEIAERLYGPDVGPENVLVFPGAQAAVAAATRAVVGGGFNGGGEDGGGGGGHAITFSPGYQSLVEGPSHAGCRNVTTIKLRPDEHWKIVPSKVLDAIRDDTRYIVMNEPYNPAGTLMDRSTRDEIVRIASERGIYVLCDEVYRLLEHDDADRLEPIADVYDRGMSCVTLSKPWGACGVSIGWLVSRDADVMDRLTDVQYFGTACPSRASEIQAMMVLRNSDVILSRNLNIIRRNLALLTKFVEVDYPDLFEWVRPTAGAICAIKFRGPMTSEQFGEVLASEAGIGIKPAYCFSGDDVTDDVDYFRVGFGERCMPESLDALVGFVEERKDGWRRAMSSSSTTTPSP